ncbi:hypothetical protein K4A83_04010 [Spirulina subsalsa FACHB-351]|uniref:Uncharacterized protein n=1 Tax=Spirulina subsalsa FACHB-351 TaxID=234711 RepID=A0ABT3L2N1_9CYAN|nr:hypothetical protein [Spirulina subsalsa]MCW6035442.1 hypothetical protein [Spirulina subsalsa FACHB-351]
MMIDNRYRAALYIGLTVGSMCAIAPAQAQIPVTGGNLAGEAAFFVPSADGAIRLFDLNLNELKIESPNGVLTNPAFVPTAASFDDRGTVGEIESGDRGLIQGQLSGIAFTPQGMLVPFINRDTILSFTLTNFSDSPLDIPGTLIRPEVIGASPLIFLPNAGEVSLADDSSDRFIADPGNLQVGEFEADINAGLIDLPASLTLVNSREFRLPEPETLVRRIRFEFEGKDLEAGEYDLEFAEDGLNFLGAANRTFRIQSVGTRGEREFKVRGNVGYLDIHIPGVSNDVDGEINLSRDLDSFRIKTENRGVRGITSIFGQGAIAFSGEEGEVSFEFKQGNTTITGEGEDGVNFYATAGLTPFRRTVDLTEFRYYNPVDDENLTLVYNITNPTIVTGSDLQIGSSVVRFFDDGTLRFRRSGGTFVTLSRNTSFSDLGITFSPQPTPPPQGGSSVVVITQPSSPPTPTPSSPSAPPAPTLEQTLQVFITTFLVNAPNTLSLFNTSSNLSVFNLSDASGTAQVNYEILQSVQFNARNIRPGRVKVRSVNNRGASYLVATRSDRGRAVGLRGFQQIGPNSRIFPGLVGLNELSPEQVEEITSLLGVDDNIPIESETGLTELDSSPDDFEGELETSPEDDLEAPETPAVDDDTLEEVEIELEFTPEEVEGELETSPEDDLEAPETPTVEDDTLEEVETQTGLTELDLTPDDFEGELETSPEDDLEAPETPTVEDDSSLEEIEGELETSPEDDLEALETPTVEEDSSLEEIEGELETTAVEPVESSDAAVMTEDTISEEVPEELETSAVEEEDALETLSLDDDSLNVAEPELETPASQFTEMMGLREISLEDLPELKPLLAK